MAADNEVLIVDDDIAAAETYARMLLAETGLHTVAVKDPTVALEFMHSDPIKVAVLDQRMPMPGTQMIEHLRAVDQRLRAILLTGQADLDEVGQAVGLFQAYLKKRNVLELPAIVLDEYSRYLEAARSIPGDGELVHKYRRGILGRRFRVEFKVTFVDIVDAEYIPDESWHTVTQISTGETKRNKETLRFTEGLQLEQEAVVRLGSNFGIRGTHLQPIEAGLHQAISAKLGTKTTMQRERVVGREEVYGLSTTGPDANVRARAYQRAPIQRRLLVGITRTCACCEASVVTTIKVLESLPRLATRQVDYVDGEKPKINRTADLESP